MVDRSSPRMCVIGRNRVPSYSFANIPGLKVVVWDMVNQELAVLEKREKVNTLKKCCTYSEESFCTLQ